MSNTYIGSSSVNVFPTALRTTVGTGKFTSENNITGIIRAVANDSYIISYPDSSSLYTGNWEFVIYGYYFNTTGLGLTSGTNIYAQIKLDASDRLVGWDGSAILDSDNLFKALYITSESPGTDADGVHTIQLISNGAVNHEVTYEIDSDKIKVVSGASPKTSPWTTGAKDLQDEISHLEDNIGDNEDRLDSIEGDIGDYTSSSTISSRLYNIDSKDSSTVVIDTSKGAIGKNATDIASIRTDLTTNYVRKTSTSTEFYTNTMNNAGIQFIADESTNSEYNNKGVSFNTGNTGVSVKQYGSDGSIMGIRAENEVHIGILNNTKLNIGSSNTTTHNTITPDTDNSLNLGSTSNKFNTVYGNSFTGKAGTAGTADYLGSSTIGQGPTGTDVVTSKTMYLNNGAATTGITITFSTGEPSGGSNGDIWFKYLDD